jgi:hypothetical protein
MADTWFTWSATDTANITVDGTGINTGMAPSNVDNALRKIMAACRNSVTSALQNFLNGTAALPVANGGTGATSSANALTSLGALSSTYRDLPVTVKSAAFTFADSERSNGIYYTGSAAAATIDPYGTTPITQGATYVIRNNGSGALTVTRGSGVTLYKNGSTSSSDAIIAVGGQATLIHWGGPDEWTITGAGVS